MELLMLRECMRQVITAIYMAISGIGIADLECSSHNVFGDIMKFLSLIWSKVHIFMIAYFSYLAFSVLKTSL